MAARVFRRLAIVCAVCATAFLVTTGVASADKPGSPGSQGPGTCPNSTWAPRQIQSTDTDYATELATDKNGNGYICVKAVPTAPGENWVDDNSHSQQGSS
jgi:hypothetical protein